MGNPLDGDVSFTAGDKSYRLRFSVNAICLLEDAAGKGIIAVSSELQDAQKLSMGLLRKIIWAGLQDHHPEIDLKAAGELIPAAGGMAKLMPVINEAFGRAFPEAASETASRPQ